MQLNFVNIGGLGAMFSKRPSLAQVTIAFSVGIAIYFAISFEPALPVLWLFTPLIILLLFFAKLFFKFRFLILMFASLLVGFLYVGLYSNSIENVKINRTTPALNIEGLAISVEHLAGGHQRLTIAEVKYPSSYNGPKPEKIRITVRVESPPYKTGDYIKVLAILEPPPRPIYPNGYDSARQYFYNELGGLGYAIAPVEVIPLHNITKRDHNRWKLAIDGLRESISKRINSSLDGQTGAVATALLTGVRSQISNQVRDNMRTSGLAHLLAISGLHMALFTGVLFFSVRALLALKPKVALLYPIKKIAAIIAWLGGAYYLLVSGMSVSTLRAFTMVSIVILAVLVDRQAISMRLLAIAALVILAIDPSVLVSASFQMSFAAVFGLIAVFEAWRRYLQNQYDKAAKNIDYENLGDAYNNNGQNSHPLPSIFQNRFIAYPFGVLASTFVAEVSLLPVSAYHFHHFAAYGLVANLLVMPIVGFWIMPFGLLALILYPFGLEWLALKPMGLGIDAMLYVANSVAGLDGSLINIPNMPTASFLCIVFAAIFMLWLRGRGRVRGLVTGLLLVASMFIWQGATQPDIIVENEGKTIALSDGKGGYYFSSLQGGRYARTRWAERFGMLDTPHFREFKQSEDSNINLACDNSGCFYVYKDYEVGMPRTFSALAQDCLRVDILITNLRVQGTCPKPKYIIDSRSLRYEGAQALWLDENDINIKTVEGERGKRLWSFANE